LKHGGYEDEMGNNFSTRIEGTCIKHRMGAVAVKMYDKFGLVLRVETVANDVSFFKHHRRVEHRDGTWEMKDAPVKSFPWKGVLWAVFIIGLCTAVNKLLFSYLALANLIMVYLLGVTWLAYRYGRYISIIGTFLSIACFDFFFIPPFYTFSVMDKEHIITFGVMLLVGLIIGNTTGRLRRQTIGLRLREERTQVLYSLSRDLAKSSRPDELFQTAALRKRYANGTAEL